MRRLVAVALLALAGCMALGSASAGAAPSDPFFYQSSFDGSETPAGSFFAGPMAINHATGNILVYDELHSSINQFDPNGRPVDFSSLGTSTIPLGTAEQPASGELAVDNSGGPKQGNIYVRAGVFVFEFGPDGGSLLPAPLVVSRVPTCGVVAAPTGGYWVIALGGKSQLEFTGAGRSLQLDGTCGAAFDELGNFYTGSHKYDANTSFSYLGETGDTSLLGIAVDPSTNDVYYNHGGSITGLRYSDPLQPSAPFERLSGLNSEGMAFDASGQTLFVAEGARIDIFHREPPAAPNLVGPIEFPDIRTDFISLHGTLMSKGSAASYRVEYGTTTAYGSVVPVPDGHLPLSDLPVGFTTQLEGLSPGTTYHLRVVATNAIGTTLGPDVTVATRSVAPPDPCPNALARKQTGASRLLDCRAYELVSAADSGGYDVESSLVAGQQPFPGFPLAKDRVLYATHSGAVPGPWKATNKGPDPYVATRGEGGWSTNYVGLPSDINPLSGGFSSVLGGADAGLNSFAFVGAGLCSPCFSSGLETGIPLRLPGGALTQGMSGSLASSVPSSAKPEGKVAKYFSADGNHLIFASKYAFEPGANDNGADLTVYDRDLKTGTTQIASRTPAGSTLSGAGISELDISADGSRIVIGQKVSSDSAGNEYLHPYLHLGTSPNSVDLAPGTTSGVLYAGMTSDGSKLFFTTPDKLIGADTNESADLYAADIDDAGNLDLSLITSGAPNTCNPVANSPGPHWNSTAAAANCDAVAIGGGGGVASASGAIYFLSPEQLDGAKGALEQPNLYVAAQAGQAPAFIATLSPDDSLVSDSVWTAGARKTADFNLTPSGAVAAFPSTLPLTGVDANGNAQIFRYATAAGQLDCASCTAAAASKPAGSADSTLAASGLSLTDDGRVFFTSPLAGVLRDTNERKDVYEWREGSLELVSRGLGPFDSGLLSVTSDGTDAYFFTHDALAAGEDGNGNHTRIYDARVNGGFFKLPPPVDCAASDECHGPGTLTPPAPDIRSSGKTTTGNVLTCAKNRVKRRGKCVKRQTHAKKKHAKKAHAKKRAAKSSGKRGGRHA